jgi:hypothetical protein
LQCKDNHFLRGGQQEVPFFTAQNILFGGIEQKMPILFGGIEQNHYLCAQKATQNAMHFSV